MANALVPDFTISVGDEIALGCGRLRAGMQTRNLAARTLRLETRAGRLKSGFNLNVPANPHLPTNQSPYQSAPD
jgi:hypothetical protein